MSPLLTPQKQQQACINNEAERAVLGSLLLRPEGLHECPTLDRLHFASAAHRIIFSFIKQQVDEDAPSDPVTIFQMIRDDGSEDDAGGMTYLMSCTHDHPAAINLKSWAQLLRTLYIRRNAAQILADHRESLLTPEGAKPSVLLHQAQEALNQLQEGTQLSPLFVTTHDKNPELMDILSGDPIEARYTPTGFIDLDRILGGGFYHGDFIVIGARPSHGKSALAVAIAWHFITRHKLPVFLASYEMLRTDLELRMIAQDAVIDLTPLRKGKSSKHARPGQPSDLDKARASYNRLQQAPRVYLADKGSDRTLSTLISAVNQAHRHSKGQLGLIIVDYIQQVDVPTEPSREREVSKVSKRLQQLAGKLKLPVLALAQLNRKCEDRPDKIPFMSDIRESGSIEQDADVIILLQNVSRTEKRPEGVPKPPVSVIRGSVSKDRNGSVGGFELLFRDASTRFDSLKGVF